MAKIKPGEGAEFAKRKQGSRYRTTEQLRTGIKRFLFKNLVKLQQDFDKLNGSERLRAKERLLIYEKFLSHVLPKPGIDLEKLSERDLDILINHLKAEKSEKSDIRKIA